MKRMISLFTAAALALGMSVPAFAAEINVTVEGISVPWTDARPFIDENDRTLVPLRPIANALGLEVSWDDDKNQASFTDGETTAEFVVGSNEYHCFLNDFDMHVYVTMDTTPVIKGSRIYAPARYLAECFQYAVGWDQAAQTVTMVKAEVPAEDPVKLPEVPAGEIAVLPPVTAEAGSYALTEMVFNGVTFVEDPDIFEYSIEADTTLNGLGFGYSIMGEAGFISMEIGTDLSAAPGTYPVTFTVPKGYFSDAEEDIVVSTTFTVTSPKAETVLERILDDLSWGVETTYGANAAEITEATKESVGGMLEETPFQMTLTDGDWSYDSEGNIIRELWDCTVTVTNTETGESASETNVLIPLTFDPESAW